MNTVILLTLNIKWKTEKINKKQTGFTKIPKGNTAF